MPSAVLDSELTAAQRFRQRRRDEGRRLYRERVEPLIDKQRALGAAPLPRTTGTVVVPPPAPAARGEPMQPVAWNGQVMDGEVPLVARLVSGDFYGVRGGGVGDGAALPQSKNMRRCVAPPPGVSASGHGGASSLIDFTKPLVEPLGSTGPLPPQTAEVAVQEPPLPSAEDYAALYDDAPPPRPHSTHRPGSRPGSRPGIGAAAQRGPAYAQPTATWATKQQGPTQIEQEQAVAHRPLGATLRSARPTARPLGPPRGTRAVVRDPYEEALDGERRHVDPARAAGVFSRREFEHLRDLAVARPASAESAPPSYHGRRRDTTELIR